MPTNLIPTNIPVPMPRRPGNPREETPVVPQPSNPGPATTLPGPAPGPANGGGITPL
jgi:hypothetical protein